MNMENNKNTLIIKVLLLLSVSIGLAGTVSAANTWTANEFTWFSEAGDNDTQFTCYVGDTIKCTKTANFVSDNKLLVLYNAYSNGGLLKDITPGGRDSVTASGVYEAVKDGTFKIQVHDMYIIGPWNDKEYTVTVLK